MKKIIISAAVLLLTGATAFAVNQYSKKIYGSGTTDALTNANIEALYSIGGVSGEILPFNPNPGIGGGGNDLTLTTWRCDDQKSTNPCKQSCGKCNTVVEGTGSMRGFHLCAGR